MDIIATGGGDLGDSREQADRIRNYEEEDDLEEMVIHHQLREVSGKNLHLNQGQSISGSLSDAVSDLKSNGSIRGNVARSQASDHGGLSISVAVAVTRPVAKIGSGHDYGSKRPSDAAAQKEGNRGDFAKRLKKDSVAGFDMNKKTKVSKNFFHGKATGNFQVIELKD